jgi:hypothetical protein
MAAGEKRFDGLPLVDLLPAHKSTGKEAMAYAKQLVGVGHGVCEDYHEIPQRHWQEEHWPTHRDRIHCGPQRVQMPGPLEEHTVGGVLTFLLDAPQNAGMTTRQYRLDGRHMLAIGGGQMRSDAWRHAFFQMKGFTRLRRHPRENLHLART